MLPKHVEKYVTASAVVAGRISAAQQARDRLDRELVRLRDKLRLLHVRSGGVTLRPPGRRRAVPRRK